MKNRKWIGGLTVLAVVLAIIGYTIFSRSFNTTDIVIGATLPLSGEAAAWGKNTQDGIELAVSQLNSAGGVLNQKLKVTYEDTKGLAREGVSAYQKLVSVDKVHAIIDDSISSVTLAMAPIAEKDSVVILATGATAPKISDAGEFIFRIWNSDTYEGEFASNFAYKSLGLRRVAILYVNNDYGTGLESVFKTQFTKLGGQVVASEAFAQNTTDMRTQLTKIKSANPDGLYLVGYPKETPIALRQAKELRVGARLLGTVTMQDPQLLQNAGDAAEGLMFPYPLEPEGPQVEQFKLDYRTHYGKDPGITADVGYDAVNMIVAAINISGNYSGEGIRDGLTTLKDHPGVSGVMTFDEKGDVHKPMGIKIVKNGDFEWMQ